MKIDFRYFLWSCLLALSVLAIFPSESYAVAESLSKEVVQTQNLPPEARALLPLIKQGGPFAYAKDGKVFGNYEKLLPKRQRGYYHEFTVKAPRSRGRGSRRIVVGGDPATSTEIYYSDDHYATFKRIQQ